MNDMGQMNEGTIVVTADGSHTIFHPSLQEHYHSSFGAISESRHIFIGAGLLHILQSISEINILEIGFGTGLNALLTLIHAQEQKVKVEYTGLEAYPLPAPVYTSLNYSSCLGETSTQDSYLRMHDCDWNKVIRISEYFTLTKVKTRLEDVRLEKEKFHLVYFDAFSPEVQPEMWTPEIFEKIFSSMANGGILVTYSCKGVVKRTLKATGFRIEKLPGPQGKREILRADKPFGI
jgi:tRNA U34 5-methylaminomethyl-2-thiouridine-forming methyltransferase MnmC